MSLVGEALLGPGSVKPIEKDLGAEDFSDFLALAPGAMFFLGVQRPGDRRLAHNPTFDIDESALALGTALLAETAVRFAQDNWK